MKSPSILEKSSVVFSPRLRFFERGARPSNLQPIHFEGSPIVNIVGVDRVYACIQGRCRVTRIVNASGPQSMRCSQFEGSQGYIVPNVKHLDGRRRFNEQPNRFSGFRWIVAWLGFLPGQCAVDLAQNTRRCANLGLTTPRCLHKRTGLGMSGITFEQGSDKDTRIE